MTNKVTNWANKQKEKELAELKANFESLNKAQRERAIKDEQILLELKHFLP